MVTLFDLKFTSQTICMKNLLTLIILICCHLIYGQKTVHYNLADLLDNDQFVKDTSNHALILNDNSHPGAISTQRILWLKKISFSEGNIDVELRGKDVFLKSFLGVAFHGKDNNHYELVYFRPFNFKHADTLRRKWSVQYMVVPEFMYDKLRKDHPLVYENAVNPVPDPGDWFHASIVVGKDSIWVYVNHSNIPSLQVKRLSDATEGMIGLWDDELSGDFASLDLSQTVTESSENK
jgi:hypothetical protein